METIMAGDGDMGPNWQSTSINNKQFIDENGALRAENKKLRLQNKTLQTQAKRLIEK